MIFIFILFAVFFLQKYISEERLQYESYNDFTRGSDVMLLSYNKNFYIQYPAIRRIQSSNFTKKETEGSLIYDFSKFDIIPILNYLNGENESKNLVESFSCLSDFFANYNAATIGLRENVLVSGANGKYYTYKDNVYTYKAEKSVIKKEFFHKMYYKYLKSIDEKNLQDNFINKLYKNTELNNIYSYEGLSNNIKNNYDKFYQIYEDMVVEVISDDLNKFCNYINESILNFPEGEFPSLKVDKEYIETEKTEIFYKFTKLDRIYNTASKYYTTSYQLDIENVWKQLADLGYPKLY